MKLNVKDWRKLTKCIDLAYAHFERRMLEAREEAVGILNKEVSRRGLSHHIAPSSIRNIIDDQATAVNCMVRGEEATRKNT